MSLINTNALQNFLVHPAMKSDPVRKEELVRMVVDVRPGFTSLPLAQVNGVDNNIVRQGKHEILVYKSDVPKVLACVEHDTAAIERAHKTYETRLMTYVKEHARGIIPPKELWATTPISPNSEMTFAKLAHRFTESNPEAEFTLMNGRGIYPLVSAEVLETLPPPVTPEEEAAHNQNKQLIDVLVAAFKQAGLGSGAGKSGK